MSEPAKAARSLPQRGAHILDAIKGEKTLAELAKLHATPTRAASSRARRSPTR